MRSAAMPRFSSKIPGFISYVILSLVDFRIRGNDGCRRDPDQPGRTIKVRRK